MSKRQKQSLTLFLVQCQVGVFKITLNIDSILSVFSHSCGFVIHFYLKNKRGPRPQQGKKDSELKGSLDIFCCS